MSEMPYIGLRPFNQTESDIFFGREEHTYQLLDKISKQHFTTVVGLSGCGKSSLINAGLIPGIQRGLLAKAGVFWRIITTRPGVDPFGNLAEALLNQNVLKDEYDTLFEGEDFQPDEKQAFLEGSLLNSYNLQETLHGLKIKPKNTNFLLIVDQFEEIFKFREQVTDDKNEEFDNITQANQFVNFLLQSSEELSNVYVLISMRSEFTGECAKFYDLAEKVNQTLFLVPRLTRLQLQEAIEKPIQVYEGSIDENLVCQILNDADNEPDQLPLIQHLLMGIWNKIRSEAVSPYVVEINDDTLYKAYGGLQGSLPQHIDKVYNELEDEKDKLIAEYLFKNLVEVNENLPNIRRFAKLGDVFEIVKSIAEKRLKQSIDFKDIIRVTNQFRVQGRHFVEPRIEDVDLDDLTEETKINLTHESLIRHWERLQVWIAEEEEDFKLYCSLEEAFERWNNNGRCEDDLLKGAILAQAEEWIDRECPTNVWAKRYTSIKSIGFDELIEFIDKSKRAIRYESLKRQQELRNRVELYQQQAKVSEEKIELEKENAKNKRRIAWGLAAISLVLSILLIIGSWFFFELSETHQKLEISENERTQLLFDSRITQSVSQIENNQFTLSKAVLKENFALLDETATISPISQHVNKFIWGYTQLFSQTQATETFGNFDSEIYSLVPVDKGFIIGGKLGKWGFLNTNEQTFTTYPELGSNVYAVTTYKPKNWLITGDASGKIIVWDENLNRISEIEITNGITSLVTVNNHIIVGDFKGLLHYGEIAEQGLHELLSISAHNEQISQDGLSLNRDKTKLLTASHDKTAKLWELDNNAKPTKINILKGDSKIYKAVFNADDSLIATANEDNSISLFDMQGGKISNLIKHKNEVFALQFSKDNHYLISGSQDNDIIVWDIESKKPLQTLEGHEATISNLILDNQTLWSSSIDGRIKRWELDLPYHLIETCEQAICPPFNPLDIEKTYRKHPIATATSPKGDYLVVGFLDGTLRLYDLSNMQILQEIAAHQKRIRNIEFNKNGNLMITASYDDTVGLWELIDGNLKQKKYFTAEAGVYDIAFSPNNKNFVAASINGKISTYQLSQSIPQHSFPLYDKYALYVDFIDEKNLLVTGDNQAHILNINSGHKTTLDTAKEANDIFGAIYSDISHYFATYGQEGKLKIYDKNHKLIQSFVAHNNTIYKAQFSSDGYQIATVSSDETLKVWDITAKVDKLLFSIDLPINNIHIKGVSSSVYDFDFRCTPTGCWIVIPMLHGRIATYNFGEIYQND